MDIKGVNPLYQLAEETLVNSKIGGLNCDSTAAIQYRHAYWK